MRLFHLKQKNRSLRKGFTLPEVLMTVLLFSALFGVCLNLLLSGSSSWQVNSTQVEVLQELIKAHDWLVRDLRQSGSGVITNVPANGTWYTTITFRKSNGVSGGNIAWSSSTIQYSNNSDQLQRSTGGVSRAIAQNIESLQIRRQATTPNIIEISLQGQKSSTTNHVITANLTFKFKLRN